MKIRPRRLRRTEPLRGLVRETRLAPADLILPIFVKTGTGLAEPVQSMPGVHRHSPDTAAGLAAEALERGIAGVLLFGLPDAKAEDGSPAWDPDGPVPAAIRSIRGAAPGLVLFTDVCLCAYTTHGHCGLVENGEILNDPTCEALARQARVHAAAGADFVAPSDMMDGRVGVLRDALDRDGFVRTGILSYAVKYASAFYGPFREAAESAPAEGDRRSHQMDPANVREALREVRLDLAEGADMVMVKPALACLDVIRAVRAEADVPVVAYNVSGEYSMIRAAAAAGWVDERAVALESLTAMRRAGADAIVTYHALEAARWLQQG